MDECARNAFLTLALPEENAGYSIGSHRRLERMSGKLSDRVGLPACYQLERAPLSLKMRARGEEK